MKKEELSKYIAQRVQTFIPLLHLGEWDIDYVFGELPTEEEIGERELGSDWQETGSNKINWAYQKALIIFYYENIENEPPEEIDKIILHELGHVLVAEMTATTDKINHEEHTVCQLAKIIYELLPAPLPLEPAVSTT